MHASHDGSDGQLAAAYVAHVSQHVWSDLQALGIKGSASMN